MKTLEEGEMRNAYKTLIRRLEGNRPLERQAQMVVDMECMYVL
jgi:hypothetical protein